MGSRVWGFPAWVVYILFGAAEVVIIVLLSLTAVDKAYAPCGAAVFVMMGLAVGFMRTSVRSKLAISGDMCSDMMAAVFAFPFAIGQMSVEKYDFSKGISQAKGNLVP